MLRKMLTQSIRNDPEWMGGNYTAQPKNMQNHLLYYGLATIGGNEALMKQAPNSAKGDALIAQRLSVPFRGDANDTLYQWDSSRDYDPAPQLDKIQAATLVINAADDERNPPATGIMERELRRVKNGRYYLIPASDQTAGHGTTGNARWWKAALADWLPGVPKR